MDAFQISEVLSRADRSTAHYEEFIRRESLSVGLYTLPAGARDPQQPHDEDEVYYVVSGRGAITVAGEERAVDAGAVVFVAAGVEHRFLSIQDDLVVLVFFAPAEYSRKSA